MGKCAQARSLRLIPAMANGVKWAAALIMALCLVAVVINNYSADVAEESTLESTAAPSQDNQMRLAIQKQIAKVRKLQQQVLRARASKKIIQQAPKDSLQVEKTLTGWQTRAAERNFALTDRLQAQHTINRLRPLYKQEEAQRARILEREKLRAKSFMRAQKWWTKLAQAEKSPTARFRTLLKELGSAKGHARTQLYRRVLRMWHNARDQEKRGEWRLQEMRKENSQRIAEELAQEDATAQQ